MPVKVSFNSLGESRNFHFVENLCLIGSVQKSAELIKCDLATRHVDVVERSNSSTCTGRVLFENMLFTAYESEDIIQFYNTDTDECFQFTQESGILTDVRALVCSRNVLVGICIKKIILWPIQGNELGPSFSVLLDSLNAIPAVSETRSKLIDDTTLLIVNSNPGGHCFQVWKIPAVNQFSAPELLCYGELESMSETIISFSQFGKYIVTSTNNTYQIWDISGRGKLVPRTGILESKMCVTCIYTDQYYIVMGDNMGNVFIFGYKGETLKVITAQDGLLGETDIHSVELSKLKLLFTKKINAITRIGRHLLVSSENGVFRVYDIYKRDGTLVEEARDKRVSFRDFRCSIISGKPIVYMIYSTLEGGGNKQDLCTIELRTKMNEVSSPFDIIEACFHQISQASNVLELTESMKEDIDKIGKVLATFTKDISMPFAVTQEVINSFDKYSTSLLKLPRSQSMKSKNAPEAERAHENLVQMFSIYSQVYRALTSSQINLAEFQRRDPMRNAGGKAQINSLLEEILESLESIHKKCASYLEEFDDICNTEIKDPDTILPLLDIYVKLKQV